MSVADGKLLELHERALNMVRAAVRGLDAKTLCWREPDTGKTIAGEVVHVCEAERFWLRDAGIEPQLDVPSEQPSSVEELVAGLDRGERRFASLLSERPGDHDLRWRLCRVSQHALYHAVRIVHFRTRQQPDWTMPHWDRSGSWEHAVDLITELMLAE
jgi:hypothetical protein